MPRPNYIEPEVLSALVREYKRTGRVSEELGRCLMLIAGGLWDRYHFTASRDDFVQEVVLHLMQNPLQKADAQKHVFNYFTTCAFRFGQKLRDKAYGDARRFGDYAAELVESGRQLPTRHDAMDLGELSEWTGDDPVEFKRYKSGRRGTPFKHRRG
ncbi:unnamed protein product [Gemmata massiliana]|uniref:Sigma-70 family RNA polymerase sigma factor n=1 Tax=Gemmata massiliana TaxID=1210884 RepID=A0A6P2D2Z9_9BACT|nr:hypothetical protein [Gemmata massiliana]VTR95247.1 unnamed protein product [Gemmata massiliana]